MTEAEFSLFFENTIQDYAREKAKAGNWPEHGALEQARRETQILLPQGIHTPQHSFFCFQNKVTNEIIGSTWLQHRDATHTVFIFDFFIRADLRGQGLGRRAFALIEDKAREWGAERMSLHVFGHNLVARHIYESLGFETTNLNMSKKL